MQEKLDRANENEPKDAKRPRQDNRVRTDARSEGNSRDIQPESRNRQE